MKSKLTTMPEFNSEITELRSFYNKNKVLFEHAKSIILNNNKRTADDLNLLNELIHAEGLKSLSAEFHNKLKLKSLVKRNKLLQIVANNLRNSGNPFKEAVGTTEHVFTICELINDLIKMHKNLNGYKNDLLASCFTFKSNFQILG
jgi:hypothetical protein